MRGLSLHPSALQASLVTIVMCVWHAHQERFNRTRGTHFACFAPPARLQPRRLAHTAPLAICTMTAMHFKTSLVPKDANLAPLGHSAMLAALPPILLLASARTAIGGMIDELGLPAPHALMVVSANRSMPASVHVLKRAHVHAWVERWANFTGDLSPGFLWRSSSSPYPQAHMHTCACAHADLRVYGRAVSWTCMHPSKLHLCTLWMETN